MSLQVNVEQGSVDESRRLKGVWLTSLDMDIEYMIFGGVYLVPDSVSASPDPVFKEPVDLTRLKAPTCAVNSDELIGPVV